MNDFEHDMREQLRAKERQIDDSNLDQLRMARRRAVAKNRGLRIPNVLLPLGGMTLASLAIFFLVLSPPQTTDTAFEPLSADSGEMQDLDFYYWLAETQNVSEI